MLNLLFFFFALEKAYKIVVSIDMVYKDTTECKKTYSRANRNFHEVNQSLNSKDLRSKYQRLKEKQT
jgi:hypothetical protein